MNIEKFLCKKIFCNYLKKKIKQKNVKYNLNKVNQKSKT